MLECLLPGSDYVQKVLIGAMSFADCSGKIGGDHRSRVRDQASGFDWKTSDWDWYKSTPWWFWKASKWLCHGQGCKKSDSDCWGLVFLWANSGSSSSFSSRVLTEFEDQWRETVSVKFPFKSLLRFCRKISTNSFELKFSLVESANDFSQFWKGCEWYGIPSKESQWFLEQYGILALIWLNMQIFYFPLSNQSLWVEYRSLEQESFEVFETEKGAQVKVSSIEDSASSPMSHHDSIISEKAFVPSKRLIFPHFTFTFRVSSTVFASNKKESLKETETVCFCSCYHPNMPWHNFWAMQSVFPLTDKSTSLLGISKPAL